MDNPVLPMMARRAHKLLGDMDRALAEGPWLAGYQISLADAGLIAYVVRLEHLAMTMMFAERPHLADWLSRMKARPSYKRGLEDWLNADYLTLSAATGADAFGQIAEMLDAA